MRRVTIILRYALALVILLVGGIGLVDELTNGYDPNSKDILLFSSAFRDLHNAIMLSYLGVVVRGMLVFCGVLMFTKRYWYLGLLMFMPIAVNILAMHLFYDLPPAHLAFFSIGIFVSVVGIFLFVYEWGRFKSVIYQKD